MPKPPVPAEISDRKRVSAWIDIDRWHGWGKFENTDVEHGEVLRPGANGVDQR